MERKMLPVEVFLNKDGMIVIEQSELESETVILHPEQVDSVCKWLQDVKGEYETEFVKEKQSLGK